MNIHEAFAIFVLLIAACVALYFGVSTDSAVFLTGALVINSRPYRKSK